MTGYKYLVNHIKHRGILRLESDELNHLFQAEGLYIAAVYFLTENAEIGVFIADNESGKRYTLFFTNIPSADEVIERMQ